VLNKEDIMAAIAFTVPVLPGKTGHAEAFFREVRSRIEEFTKSRVRSYDQGDSLGHANPNE
jgi:hypothetical protein